VLVKKNWNHFGISHIKMKSVANRRELLLWLLSTLVPLSAAENKII
jgi:hypothetical protein